MIYYVTLKVKGYPYAKFYLIRVCSIRVPAKQMLINYTFQVVGDSISAQKANASVKGTSGVFLGIKHRCHCISPFHHSRLKSSLPRLQHPIKHKITN